MLDAYGGKLYTMSYGQNTNASGESLESSHLCPRQHRRPACGVAALRLAGACCEARIRGREGVSGPRGLGAQGEASRSGRADRRCAEEEVLNSAGCRV